MKKPKMEWRLLLIHRCPSCTADMVDDPSGTYVRCIGKDCPFKMYLSRYYELRNDMRIKIK